MREGAAVAHEVNASLKNFFLKAVVVSIQVALRSDDAIICFRVVVDYLVDAREPLVFLEV